MSFDRRLTIGVVMAVAVQAAGVLLWAGAAAERVSTLEERVRAAQPVSERLARVEAELGAMRTQLERIERKLEENDRRHTCHPGRNKKMATPLGYGESDYPKFE